MAIEIDRRTFVKGAAAMGAAVLAFPALAACSESRGSASKAVSASSEAAGSGDATASSSAAPAESAAASATAPDEARESSAAADASSGVLVAYFSRADENYEVGYIEQGNTAIVANMIAEQTGADLFEIVPSESYPEGYDDCCDVALDEQKAGSRPAIVDAGSLDDYDTIYLGYPIWWGDLPMCVYTYLESHDWAGKQVLPFCTHGGSGLAGTEAALQSACAGATVGSGLSIAGATAQNSRDEARSAVEAWLG